MIKVAVIGVGHLGRQHARLYAELTGVELAGVVDILEPRAEEIAGLYKTTAFTDYHDIVAWNQGNRKLAELCAQYLQKGRLVYVEGRLQTRSWDDAQSGQKRYKTEVNASDVQFLDSRGESTGETAVAATVGGAAEPEPAGVGGDVDPDDIPF